MIDTLTLGTEVKQLCFRQRLALVHEQWGLFNRPIVARV